MRVASVILGAAAMSLWFTRPYSFDLIRYGLWRIGDGHAFVQGSVLCDDARIAWRTIGPLDPDPIADPLPPLVLLHGGLGSDLDWYAEVPVLARRHSLVLIDTRGHGSSTLGDEPLSYRLFVDDVIAVLDALGHDRVDITGWSDGGNTGLLLALEHPERVRRLVAISANAHPGGLVPKVLETLDRDGGAKGSLVGRTVRALLSPEPGRWEELTKHITALWRAYPRIDDQTLASIPTPTLLIAGSEDDVRIGHLDKLSDVMPQATLVVLPGVSHSVPQSAARDVLALMTRFLESPEDAGASVAGGTGILSRLESTS